MRLFQFVRFASGKACILKRRLVNGQIVIQTPPYTSEMRWQWLHLLSGSLAVEPNEIRIKKGRILIGHRVVNKTPELGIPAAWRKRDARCRSGCQSLLKLPMNDFAINSIENQNAFICS